MSAARSLALVVSLGLASCIVVQDFGDHGGPSGQPDADADANDGAVTDGPLADQLAPNGDGDVDADGAATDLALIPGGAVTVLWDKGRGGGTSTLSLSHDFYVDVHEVTVAQFRTWLTAGMPAPCPGQTCSLEPDGAYATSMRWFPGDDAFVATNAYQDASECFATAVFHGHEAGDVPTYPLGDDRLPINCVTFAQAVAVCHSRGMRLLTEVEWYWMASGHGQARTYPWGDDVPSSCTKTIFGLDTDGSNKCGFPKDVLFAPGDLSRDGIHDLGGSVREWVWGAPRGTPFGPLPNDDVGVPRGATDDVLAARGGDFASRADYVETRYAWTADPTLGSTSIGLRCARSKL